MSRMHFDFSDKAVVVTGAANGIGAACARLFSSSGARLALWDIDAAAAQALAAELGGDARPIRCDVSSRAEVEAAIATTLAAFGRIDVLINNAGIFRNVDFLDHSEDDWDAVIGVNLKGAFLVGQAIAREMVKSGGGAIVNMSSVNAVMAIPTLSSYNASKGGIDQLTRAMALSLVDRGIRVNAVAPGTIATELARKAQTLAISEGSPSRRRGVRPRIFSFASALESTAFLASSVAIVPGATALTRMPRSTSASAIARVSWSMPPLLAL